MLIFLALLLTLGAWYTVFSLECAVNGGTICRNPRGMAFELWWEDVNWYLLGKRVANPSVGVQPLGYVIWIHGIFPLLVFLGFWWLLARMLGAK